MNDLPLTADSGILLKVGDITDKEYHWKIDKCPLQDRSTDDYFIEFINRHNITLVPIGLSETLSNKIEGIARELKFRQEISETIKQIVRSLIFNIPEEKIQISKTSESEFLIYIQKGNAYKNILIDEDGDIEILFIPKDKGLSYNKLFYEQDGFDLPKIVSTFNEM